MSVEAHHSEDTIQVGPIGVRTDATEVAEFAAALGLQLAPGSVPLTFPIRWLALPAIREVMEKAIGTFQSLHASQSFQFGTSIETDRDYSFRVAIRQVSTPTQRFIVHGAVTDQNDNIVVQLETVLCPITAISAASMPNEYVARNSALPEIEIGPIDIQKIERYAAAAHDHNRLHSDVDFARSVGLDGPILHGMMVMGLFQKALSEWPLAMRVSRLFALFVRPVPVGSRLIIGGRIVSAPNAKAEVQRTVRLFVRTDRVQIACIGEAAIVPDPSSNQPAS